MLWIGQAAESTRRPSPPGDAAPHCADVSQPGQFDLVTWVRLKRVSRMVQAGPDRPSLSPGPSERYGLQSRLDPPNG